MRYIIEESIIKRPKLNMLYFNHVIWIGGNANNSTTVRPFTGFGISRLNSYSCTRSTTVLPATILYWVKVESGPSGWKKERSHFNIRTSHADLSQVSARWRLDNLKMVVLGNKIKVNIISVIEKTWSYVKDREISRRFPWMKKVLYNCKSMILMVAYFSCCEEERWELF